MAQIVVSYARQDRTAVEHLVKDLELMGHHVWIDRDITGGAAWWQEVLASIRQCDVLIFAISADSLASDACRRESYYTHRLDRAIIPVEVTQSVSRQLLPPDLQQLHIVAYLQESKEEFAQISRAIQNAPRRPLPASLPAAPAVPLSYLLRIQHRLNDPKPITVDDQDTIVAWLEHGIRREDERREAVALLSRMQTRRGLDAQVSERITRVLAMAQAAPAPPGPQPMNIRPPASAMAAAPGATTTRPVAAWRAPMYTLLVLCALLPVICLVVLAVALGNLGRQERRGQALTLVVITLVMSVGYGLVLRSLV